MQKSMTLNDPERSKRICSHRYPRSNSIGRNGRLALVLLTYLFYSSVVLLFVCDVKQVLMSCLLLTRWLTSTVDECFHTPASVIIDAVTQSVKTDVSFGDDAI